MISWFRTIYPNVSNNLKTIRNLYCKKQTSEAYSQFKVLRSSGEKLLQKPGDALLLRDVLIAVGKFKTANAIIRISSRLFKQHLETQLNWLIVQSKFRNSLSLLDQAQNLRSLCQSKSEEALHSAVCARLAASFGVIQTSEKHLLQAWQSLGKRQTEGWMHLCIASALLKNWDRAVKAGRQLLSCDSKQENKVLLISTLLSQGNLTEARKLLDSLDQQKGVFYPADYFASQFHYFLGNLEFALERLQQLKTTWPDSVPDSIDHSIVHLNWMQGNIETAQELAKEIDSELYEQLVKAPLESKRVLIPLPVMTQEPLMCVPTTVAMCASAFDIKLNPNELFKAMRGNDGTEIWRMQAHLETLGFEVLYLKPDVCTVKYFLDNGIPLIGSLLSLFSAHVEVIAGYDEGMKRFFIRDPELLSPNVVNEDYISQAYKAAGNYLIAIAPKGRFGKIDKEVINNEANNLIALSRAVAEGQTEEALKLYKGIPDHSDCAFIRDIYGFGVSLSPSQYSEAMKQYANNRDVAEVTRLKAAMNTQNSEFFEQWVQEFIADNNDVSQSFTHYLDMLVALNQRDFELVLKKLSFLLAKSPSCDALWINKAEAELELGLLEEARKSVQIAQDLSPKSYSIKQRLRRLYPYQERFSTTLSSLEEHIDEYPGVYQLEEEYADLLIQGGNGFAYESAIKKCIEKRPLLPWNYNKLANWYLNQNRVDLARAIMQEARLHLTEEDLPKQPFEEDQETARTQEEQLTELDTSDTDQPLEPAANARRIIHRWLEQVSPSKDDISFLSLLLDKEKGDFEELELSWWEQVQLWAISYALADREGRSSDELRSRLPESLPGVTVYSVLSFNRALEYIRLSSSACNILYEWQVSILGGSEWRYDVDFDLSYLREQAGLLNEAQTRYSNIVKKVPGYAAAHYRLATVLDRKGMLNEAVKQYESSLTISPRIENAARRLVDIYADNQRYDDAVYWSAYLKKISPYNFECIERWINFVAQAEGMEEAFRQLELHAKYLTNTGLCAIRARLLEQQEQYTAALAELDKIDNDVELDRHILVTRVHCSLRLKDWQMAMTLCDQALERAPDDHWFIDARLATLSEVDPNSMGSFVAACLGRNVVTENLVNCWIKEQLEDGQVTENVYSKARDMIIGEEGTAANYALARYLTQFFGQNTDMYLLIKWLEIAITIFPLDDYFTEVLAGEYLTLDQNAAAEKLVHEYYEANREDTNAILLMGKVLEDTNPTEAMIYLQEAYKKSGSVESLSRIGRVHHLLREHTLAIETYWQVLKLDPLHDLAMNNLLILGMEARRMSSYFLHALSLGIGGNTQYFLINAIKCAQSVGETVPDLWLPLAQRRFKQLEIEKPFNDEKERLAAALYEWYRKAGDVESAREVLVQAGIKKPLLIGFLWPGKRWIPKQA
ncbi:tetratricopeptide repeat protein [Hahella ganghwensis]|uniref:tetratricopeptide repeat protein n=1 Tax=Hahella ganghwensis TaxID=286420 RepID=UPI0003766D82|nr:tetratricopeptide repeat protein [Hahella ganghwensis]